MSVFPQSKTIVKRMVGQSDMTVNHTIEELENVCLSSK